MGTNDGLDAESIFNSPSFGYNFDDLVSLPGQARCNVNEVDLMTSFSRNLQISNPFVSAPMDSVTEAPMAIALALSGGIGVLHCNCTAEEQASQVRKVKAFRNGFIMDPHVLSSSSTVKDADDIYEKHGVRTVLITDGGKMGSKLMGIVTSRDLDYLPDRSVSLDKVMTPKAKLVVAKETEGERQGLSLSQAQQLLRDSKKGKLPIVNEDYELVAMVSRRDLKKSRDFPDISQDANKQLLVAAAISPSQQQETIDRVRKLVEAGVDAIVLDASQGSSSQQVEFVRRVKAEFKTLDVVCGNVVTPRQAKPLLEAGADGLRVGMGCSSLCSSQEVSAVGRPQASAIYHVARYVKSFSGDVPVIADGGVQSSAHVAMALTLGASAVMCGSLFAATEESPGGAFFHNGMRMKTYSGMGSVDLQPPPADSAESSQRPQRVSCAVVDRGSVHSLVSHLLDCVRRDLRRLGVKNLAQLHEDLYSYNTRFHIRTPGAYGAASIGAGVGAAF